MISLVNIRLGRKRQRPDFESEFNGNVAVDVLEQRPNMVILWAGYAFSKDYSTPRGHMHAIEDITASLRTGAPVNPDRRSSTVYLLDLQEPGCSPYDGSIGR